MKLERVMFLVTIAYSSLLLGGRGSAQLVSVHMEFDYFIVKKQASDQIHRQERILNARF